MDDEAKKGKMKKINKHENENKKMRSFWREIRQLQRLKMDAVDELLL